jgi:hypothetical protein
VKLGNFRLFWGKVSCLGRTGGVLGPAPGCGTGRLLGIRCGGPRGDRGVEDTPLGENPQWDAPMDGEESRLWGVTLSSEGKSLVGWGQMRVGEP